MFSNLKFKLKISTVVFSGLLLTACATGVNSGANNNNFAEREKLYLSTNNNSGLISLYRDQLKNVGDDDVIRYKLAEVYYLTGDSESSMLYLEPLFASQSREIAGKAELLRIKNMINLGQHFDAIAAANRIISASPKNAEAYNLRGIAYAQTGQMDKAKNDINFARTLFLPDLTALNNLAMVYILDSKYYDAVQLLLPQYLNGVRDNRIVHNLVFALVKSGDETYALDIIRREKLNTSPESLVEALRKTERFKQVTPKYKGRS